jgi:hypothetical protein
MFFADVRNACKFEINANIVSWLYSERYENSELSAETERHIAYAAEDEICRLISQGEPFNLFEILWRHIHANMRA